MARQLRLVLACLKLLCSGFFVATVMKAMPKPLFVNARCLIISALGLMQLCQCHANTRKMVKTVQVRVADSSELTEHSSAYLCVLQKGCPLC